MTELVAHAPEVIVSSGPQNAVAVHTAAPTVPLIFMNVADPVGIGLVKSLAHPGGTATGFATIVPEGFVGKQRDLFEVRRAQGITHGYFDEPGKSHSRARTDNKIR